MARPVTLSTRALRPGPLAGLALLHLALVSAVMIWRGISVSPDYLLLLLVPMAVVSGRLLRFLGDWVPFVAIDQSLNPNPVAAFPSLHSAFPMLALLALRAVDRRPVSPALGWCLMVWFSIVHLGEHYLVDALAGIGSAALAWAVMTRLVAPRIGALREARVAASG